MTVARWNRLCAVGIGLSLACGGGGNGTEPPGPPDHLVKSGGDSQKWFFNNALPSPYSVTVQDLHNRAVPNVSVDWSITTGGGTLSPNPSTTSANGVATTVHMLGSATSYVVNATVTGVGSVTFGATASAPGTAVAVTVGDDFFSPRDTAVQVGGTVTWTWTGVRPHTVSFTNGGPESGTPPGTPQTSGTYQRTFSSVGSFSYFCRVHAMTGTVRVVN